MVVVAPIAPQFSITGAVAVAVVVVVVVVVAVASFVNAPVDIVVGKVQRSGFTFPTCHKDLSPPQHIIRSGTVSSPYTSVPEYVFP
jgi:hypothetical protein